ncbi:MAG: hypothetical protein RL653_1116, partial [Pseudomonadota bacterium]
MSKLAVGTQLDGRYEVLRLLGEGGMATVYLVRHLGLHSEHALKVLNPELYALEEVRARFLSEGRIQAKLRHPHVVPVTEIVTAPVAGLVMDYVPGQTLGEHLRSHGAFKDLAEAKRLFLQVLDGVGEAHRNGVVHRDLKPENVILGADSRGQLLARVTDFGIARLDEGGRQTRTGARMGTPYYMSPEQVRGADKADARSDIFALGSILYEMVTGAVAFAADSDFDVMQRVVSADYAPPERVVTGLEPSIAACIQRALSVKPEDRFQTCDAFAAALRGGAPASPVAQPVGTPVPARQPSPATSPAPAPSRTGGAFLVFGVLGVVGVLGLLLVTGAVGIWGWRRVEARQEELQAQAAAERRAAEEAQGRAAQQVEAQRRSASAELEATRRRAAEELAAVQRQAREELAAAVERQRALQAPPPDPRPRFDDGPSGRR